MPSSFDADLSTLPVAQVSLWPELAVTPSQFTLYGGTALALRLGHRSSVALLSSQTLPFHPERLEGELPYLRDAERIQLSPNTLTCRVEFGGPVLVSFFGHLERGLVAAPDRANGPLIRVASLLDLAGTKAAVIQKRAEVKDYLDLHAILSHVDVTALPTLTPYIKRAGDNELEP